jgi:hypothetical protein
LQAKKREFSLRRTLKNHKVSAVDWVRFFLVIFVLITRTFRSFFPVNSGYIFFHPCRCVQKRAAEADIQSFEKPHAFQTTTFRRFMWCDVCGNFLWGVVAQGVKCGDCDFVAHERCSQKVCNFVDLFLYRDVLALVSLNTCIMNVFNVCVIVLL